MCSSPLKNVQTAPRRSRCAKHLAPKAIFAECPLEYFKLPAGGRLGESFFGQPASVRVGELQNRNVTVFDDVVTHYRLFFKAAIEALLQLRYRGVRRYCSRTFGEISPGVSSLL